MRRRTPALVVFVAAWLAAAPITHAQSDPALGRWVLNVAKSKYDPGPGPKSEIRVYEAFGGVGKGATGTFERVDAAGRKIAVSYSALYDGKDYKYNGPEADTVTVTRPEPNTVIATLKRNGKVVQTTTAVVSPDGKTRTQTSAGTNAQGQKVNNVVIFER